MIAATPIIPAANGNTNVDHALAPGPRLPTLEAPFPLALAVCVPVELDAVDKADATSLLILLLKLLAFGRSVNDDIDASAVLVTSQVGKHNDVTLARSRKRPDEKLDSQLEAAAPVSVVVIPSLCTTTVWGVAVTISESRVSFVEIFMIDAADCIEVE